MTHIIRGLLVILALANGGLLLAETPRHDDDVLVGVYYFAGWWPEKPNKYQHAGKDWRSEWPGRVPLLGEYVEQKTMDREIEAAARHGVDFFQILWYRPDVEPLPEPHARKLNDGIRFFMSSPKNRLMHFTLEICNHPPFVMDDDAVWRRYCREWAEIMSHPGYLRVSGRPIVKIHGLSFLWQECGQDAKRFAGRLQMLRDAAREAGLKPPIIGAGVMPEGIPMPAQTEGIDFLSSYMDMPKPPKREELYPYADLIGYAEKAWQRYAEWSPKPCVPYVPAGWDPRPWGDPRPSFHLPNATEWDKALHAVKAALDKHDKLGLPAGDDKRVKMFVIYAWNEYAEGGIVAPTQGDGHMKLERIRKLFPPDTQSRDPK